MRHSIYSNSTRARLSMAACCAIGLLACGGLGLTGTSGPSNGVTQAAPPAAGAEGSTQSAPSATASPKLDFEGQIAVQGADDNIYILEASKPARQITSDGLPGTANGGGRLYVHPTWSPQGWLSYVRVDSTNSQSTNVDVLAIPPMSSTPQTVVSLQDQSYIYGYWAPAACIRGNRCGRFAFLVGSGDKIALHLSEVSQDGPVSDSGVGLASTFYFSWSPDGKEMLWYRDGSDLAVYDVENKRIAQRLPDTTGVFQSPAWSPTSGQWLFARAEHSANQITVADGDTRLDIGTPTSDPVFFSWAPNGQYVAHASGPYPLTGLSVARVGSADVKQFNDLKDIVAFFWSPDGTHLAVVTVQGNPGALPQAGSDYLVVRRLQQNEPQIALAWSVIDVASGRVQPLGTFFPTNEEFYILRFFDQYAQSHRVWSPDSRYLIYAERTLSDGRAVVRLLDTLHPGLPPVDLMDGYQAVFSFSQGTPAAGN